MCPGKAWTSGTSWLWWVLAAAPHTPLLRNTGGGFAAGQQTVVLACAGRMAKAHTDLNGIRWQARAPWYGPTTSMLLSSGPAR
jgi:hypothetical protein